MVEKDNRSDPYERIEVRHDGYLWLVNYAEDGGSEEEHQQPLLLHAVSTLLRQLKEPSHESISLTNTTSTTTSTDQANAKASTPQGENNKEKDSGDQEEEEVSPEDEETKMVEASLAHLERLENLADKINSTLTHVRLLKHEARKGKRDRPQSLTESKVKALQHQRERLMQQKQQQQQQKNQQQREGDKQEGGDKVDDTPPTNNNKDDSNEEGFQVVPGKSTAADAKKEDDDGSESSALQTPIHPHVRLVRALNSVRALMPVLLKIIFHPQRENKNIKVGTKKTGFPTGNGKKAKWWILGNHVFDFAPLTGQKTMHKNVLELLELFLPDHIAADMFNNPHKDWSEFWNKEWRVYAWSANDVSNPTTPPPYDMVAGLLDKPADDDADDTPKEEQEESNKQQLIAKHCKDCDEKMWANYGGTVTTTATTDDDSNAAVKQRKEYDRAVDILHRRLSFILSKDFPGSRVSVYGSCLSNLSLKASDVDLSLFLPLADRAKKSFQNGFWDGARYEKEITKLVRDVFRRLVRRKSEFRDMNPVTRARVPVVKGCFLNAKNPYTEDGSMHFDICFLNDIAVANSSLLREYSMMHPSVRDLMMAVKAWAKQHRISSAQDACLSSYGWMNMVVFYLQCIDFVPNLQCPKLAEKVGIERDDKNYWHSVNDLDTLYLSYEQAKGGWQRPDHFEKYPVSNVAFLYGFFQFYASVFPRHTAMVSIKRGKDDIRPKTCFRKCSPFFCIEDPFETYDSHCPHDLGVPVQEAQCTRIITCLKASEEHLRKIVLSYASQDTGVFEGPLWPTEVLMKPKNNSAGGGGGAGKKKKNNNNKGKGGDGGGNQKKKQDGKGQPRAQQQQATAKSGKGGNRKNEGNNRAQRPKITTQGNKGGNEPPKVEKTPEQESTSGDAGPVASAPNNIDGKDATADSKQPAPVGGNGPNDGEKAAPTKRRAECTLFVKGVSRDTTESDLFGLFKRFADETHSKMIGINLTRQGVAYVDYDSAQAVVRALDQHNAEPLRMHGRALHVVQKSQHRQNRRKGKNRNGQGNQKKNDNRSQQEAGQNPSEQN